jgi:cellulose synthase/poly-beta-1,6-N-acetylglucosamine synthase-like glycosyltransferase
MASEANLIQIVDTWMHSATDEKILKERMLELLKLHQVNVEIVGSPEVLLEEIIPTLKKLKVNVPEDFFRDLALELQMPFLDFSSIKRYTSKLEKQIVSLFPYYIVDKCGIVPLEISKTNMKIALSNPVDTKIRMTINCLFNNKNIELVVASSEAIERTIDDLYREIHKKLSLFDLYDRMPDQSAHKVLTPKQKYFLIVFLAVVALSAFFRSAFTFAVLFSIVNVAYFIINPVKIYTSLRGFQGSRGVNRITKGEMQWVCDEDLPTYTVLVPVYHEAKVLSKLMRNLHRMNYPKDKLDVKILIEQNDEETLSEARQIGLFGSPTKYVEGISNKEYANFIGLFNPVIIPPANVTTKPRACNYGLLRARGELCVVYDAEDDPDPDQLKKAAMVFLRSENNVGCLQSKLNFYNAKENLLTKWFSIEYGYWYEYYLTGLDWINAPIPLGGTSNHFRVHQLTELGRWDPYNMTEDADLGMRIARKKIKTQIIDTYTYEEAPIHIRSWIRQRSRWYKGHLQTFLVHMRHPKKLMRDLGITQFLKFQLTFGGNIFVPIINSALWLLTAITLFTSLTLYGLLPGYVQAISIFNLAVGNLTYMMLYVAACIKRKKPRVIPFALLMPIYWLLISIASLRGLIQLIRKPFYWDKTPHGDSKMLGH